MKFLLLILSTILISYNCASTRYTNVKPPLKEEFYYDSNKYSLIKLFPHKNKDIIKNYREWVSVDSNSSWGFYKKYISKIEKKNNYSKDDYKNIIKPILIERPAPDYPLDAPIIGGFLTVIVTVTIDTNGYPEYVELYNIYRTAEIDSEKDQKLSKEKIKPWTKTKIYDVDIPFIRLSLYSTLEAIFKPAELYSKRLRVKMNVPYQYIVGKEYDKRKKS